jgi:hypothetical protein
LFARGLRSIPPSPKGRFVYKPCQDITSPMWSPEILVITAATFVLAGFVKGVIGLGLPTVVLALLTATV